MLPMLIGLIIEPQILFLEVGYTVRSESAGSYSATFFGLINEGGVDITIYFNTNEPSTDPSNVWSTQGDNLIINPYGVYLRLG